VRRRPRMLARPRYAKVVFAGSNGVAIDFDHGPIQNPTFKGIYPLGKTRVSSSELSWIFREQLLAFDDWNPSIAIAIVPSAAGWSALTAARDRANYPNCVKRIEQVQKRLRSLYALSND